MTPSGETRKGITILRHRMPQGGQVASANDYTDPAGVFWHREENTGAWHYHDGSTWVPSKTPPPGLAPISPGSETEPEEIDVEDPDHVEWRQTAQGWEFLGADGSWYLGDGPEEERAAAWRQTAAGRWQYQAADGNWYFGPTPYLAPPTQGPAEPSDTVAGAWLSIIGGGLMVIGSFLPGGTSLRESSRLTATASNSVPTRASQSTA